MSFFSIATFVVTIGFALISIYIAKLLLSITGLLKGLSKTFEHVEGQLDSTITETEQLILGIEQTTNDVEQKLKATNGVFHSVQEVGQAALNVSTILKNKTQSFTEDGDLPGATPFIRSIQWGEYTSELFKSWERGKKAAFAAKEQK